jgi:hypothetical protein
VCPVRVATSIYSINGRILRTILVSLGMSWLSSANCLAEDLFGCYELKLSKWVPILALGDDETFISPPSRVVLTTTPDHTWDSRGFRVIAANGFAQSVHTFSYWVSNADHVRIRWTTGHSGLTMDLKRNGSNLVGTAHTFWDFARPQQTSHVVATKISCD